MPYLYKKNDDRDIETRHALFSTHFSFTKKTIFISTFIGNNELLNNLIFERHPF